MPCGVGAAPSTARAVRGVTPDTGVPFEDAVDRDDSGAPSVTGAVSIDADNENDGDPKGGGWGGAGTGPRTACRGAVETRGPPRRADGGPMEAEGTAEAWPVVRVGVSAGGEGGGVASAMGGRNPTPGCDWLPAVRAAVAGRNPPIQSIPRERGRWKIQVACVCAARRGRARTSRAFRTGNRSLQLGELGELVLYLRAHVDR